MSVRQPSHPSSLARAPASRKAAMSQDARDFLWLVKRTTPRETYDRFKRTLAEFHRTHLSVADFKSHIRDIFRPHPIVITNFNKFMAKYYKVGRTF